MQGISLQIVLYGPHTLELRKTKTIKYPLIKSLWNQKLNEIIKIIKVLWKSEGSKSE